MEIESVSAGPESARVVSRWARIDAGAAAEYVVGCVAAVGFAAALVRFLTSPYMYTTLWRILEKAIPWM